MILQAVRCQDCQRDIGQRPTGEWADRDGLAACQRVGDGPLLPHTPTPQAVAP